MVLLGMHVGMRLEELSSCSSCAICRVLCYVCWGLYRFKRTTIAHIQFRAVASSSRCHHNACDMLMTRCL